VKKFTAVITLLLGVVFISSGCNSEISTSNPEAELPQWQGIKIGQSVRELGEFWGEPEEILVDSLVADVEIWRYVDSSTELSFYVGVSQINGTIEYIKPIVHSAEYPLTEMYPPTLEQFIDTLGEPETVTWGGASRYTRTYVWASRGVAIEAMVPAWLPSEGTGVVRAEYFAPTDIETYFQTWGADIEPQKGYGQEDAYHNPEVSMPPLELDRDQSE
jgi:hypothetical protein